MALAVDCKEDILAEFDENGYVVVGGIFDPVLDFGPLRADYEDVLDGVAKRWHAEGKTSSDFAGQAFEERLISIMKETDESWIDYFGISLPLWDTTEETPFHYCEPIFNIMTKPAFLDVIEWFIGPEIYANPIQHLRVKPPACLIPSEKQHALNARTNWHQDLGVTLPEANDTNLLTTWITITDATEQNGCLQMIPGSHKEGRLVEHCPRTDGDIEIPPQERQGEVVKVPVNAGDVLFLHKLTKHDSAHNETEDEIRWSYDLRYNPTGEAVGRPEWPGFVCRSEKDPDSVETDSQNVVDRWLKARSWMAENEAHLVRRWKGGMSPYCGF